MLQQCDAIVVAAESRTRLRGKPGYHDTFAKYSRVYYLPRYRRRNKREMPPKPDHGKH
jgi:hypothetical protein